ncbi:MAG: hypothetical protein ACMUIE_07895 [Thermoplasmatota archaeon]
MMKERAMAMCVTMALVAVAFGGLFFVGADDSLPAELTVTVTDNYGAADDMMTYVGDDVLFEIASMGLINSTTDYTVQFILNEGTPVDMDYNDTTDIFHYLLEDVPAGVHNWNITVMNNTDMDERYLVGTLTVYEMPAFIGADFAFDEDMVYMFDLMGNFTGVDSVEIVNMTELEAEGWTFDDLGDGMYNISQAMNANGTWEFHVMGTANYATMTAEGTIMVTIDQINDAPMIEYIMYMEEEVPADLWNYTWVDEIEGNMSEWRTTYNLTGDEDMPLSFMVGASDVEMDTLEYTFEMGDIADPYDYSNDLNETNVTIPMNFTLTPEDDIFGVYWAKMIVSDGAESDEIWLVIEFENVNDAPMGEFDDIMTGDTLDRLTGAEVNVSVTVSDIDSEDLEIMWYIDGTMVPDWNMNYFLYNWSAVKVYNVSVAVSDGDLEYDIGYFYVNVTEPEPTWTADDVAVDYSAEPAKDVVGATATGDIISGYTYSGGKQIDKPGLDILDITTAIEGENLKVTMMLGGAPIEGTEIDWDDLANIPTEFEMAVYRVFFVKSTFTEPAFTLATPDMEYEPDEGEFYEVGGWLSWGYLDMGEFDTGDPVISGNSIVWTISLADLTAAGIPTDDFQLFGQAVYNKISATGVESAYDSGGFGAAQHVQPGDDDDVVDDDDDDDGGFPIWIIIVIVVVAILVILAVVFFLMKGKKGEEEPEMPPEGEMPMETEEMPMEGMEQPPMEGMEEPPMPEEQMPEQPVYEEQMPEQPVPEEPAPPVPEEPAPPMPEEPAAPPVPPQPAPPAAPPVAPPQQPIPPQPPQE